MIRLKVIVLFVVLLVCTVFYTACNEDSGTRNPCQEPRKYFLKLQTCIPADTGITGVAFKLPSPIVGFVDTAIWFYDGKVSISDFTGPVSAIADSVRWFIMPDTLKRNEVDTITFFYQRKPVFLSTGCGYTFVYSLKNLQYTNYQLDSARIEKTEVNNAADVIHVKVFY